MMTTERFSRVFHMLNLLQCNVTKQLKLSSRKVRLQFKSSVKEVTTILVLDVSLLHDVVNQRRLLFLSHISAHKESKRRSLSSVLPPPELLWDPLKHVVFVTELGNKRARVAPVFIHWRCGAANKRGEWKANAAVCILYSIIPKRSPFVVKERANCRAWWYYCTIPQQGCQGEILPPWTGTKSERKRRREQRGGRCEAGARRKYIFKKKKT